MNFAHTLKVARADRDLSQAELAEAADVSTATLSHIERGKVRPYESTRRKIEQVLGAVDWERTFREAR